MKVACDDVLEVGLRGPAGHLGLQEGAVVPQQLLTGGINSVQPDIRAWDRGLYRLDEKYHQMSAL